MAANVNNIDVVLDDSTAANAPHCPHGPTLLFERYISGGKSSKRFYACSACRDRKNCNFYQLEDEKISEAKLKRREEFNKSQLPPFTHEEYQERLQRFSESPVETRYYCIDCQLLLLPTELKQHQGNSHKLKKSISDKMLSYPTLLFSPYQNNKVYAQYHFSKKTLHLLKTTFEQQNISHILCVGVPSLHEAIQNEKSNKIQSLLLDLDHRYMQVYSAEHFCHYNMFNNYFFNNTKAVEIFQQFITEQDDDVKKLAVVFDPPFGCMIEVLAHSYNNLLKQWQNLSKKTSECILPAIIILPYFMEKRVESSFTGFSMLDYKISYSNQHQFRQDHSDTKSAVRIFTNIERQLIHLPKEEGYCLLEALYMIYNVERDIRLNNAKWTKMKVLKKYCGICCCYSSPENNHCNKCGSCTSKDGKTYIHCDKCKRCVKPNRIHCDVCHICQTKGHQCNEKYTKSGCHICGSLTHKRKMCPQNQSNIRKQKMLNEDTKCKKRKIKA